MATPNLLTLTGPHISITYSSSGFDGKPHFSYHDGMRSLSFAGDEIDVVENTPLGTLVTVSIMTTVDAGYTSFTLLVPRINLEPPGTSVAVHTVGITTIHRTSIAPQFDRGQLESYTIVRLSGSAQLVEF